MKILIIILDIVYDLFNVGWLLVKFIIDQILFYLSRLFSFIFRLKCKGCGRIHHNSNYMEGGHFLKRFWCVPNKQYMIFRCYKYIKKYKKKT